MSFTPLHSIPNFTIGIVTTETIAPNILMSLKAQRMSKFEIIIVGGPADNAEITAKYMADVGQDLVYVKHIPFEDTNAPYTIKKNLITKNAIFDNIVFMHDYMVFLPGWYDGFAKFGDDWDICMNVIQNADGSRFRDWCAWDDPELCWPSITPTEKEIEDAYVDNYHSPKGIFKNNHQIALVPYTYNKIKYMYISGAFWVAKKHVMEQEPLDEKLHWGTGEDVDWSRRTIKNGKFKYKMNVHSTVKCLKNKKLSAVIIK